jgi:hypothetical protein
LVILAGAGIFSWRQDLSMQSHRPD